jgi:hypothetical protein
MAPADAITLRCSHCGNTQRYERSADPDLPPNVVLIVTNECDKCEAADGGFGDEQWFDADGKEVLP